MLNQLGDGGVTHGIHHSQLGWIRLAGEVDLYPTDSVLHWRCRHVPLFLWSNVFRNSKPT